MKATLLIALCLLSFSVGFSQELRFGVGYQNIHSRQFDQLVQTYNFSSPFLSEKQPLLSHGIGTNAAFYFGSQRALQQGISAKHSFYNSRASNEVTVALRFQTLQLGYALRYENHEKLKGIYLELITSGIAGLLEKRVDGEDFLVDEEELQSWQFGVMLNLNASYRFPLKNQWSLMPFLGVGYAPYFSVGNSEAVINQTSTLVVEEHTSMLSWQVGVNLVLSKKER